MQQCEAIARAVAPGAERELLASAQNEAEQIVDRHWSAIEALASELLVHRKLDAGQIKAIIAPTTRHLVQERYYERRNGQDIPVDRRPDPGRQSFEYLRRCDGWV